MEMLNVKINGISVSVPKGSTILDAARLAGIEIPTLCFMKEKNEIGACRICVVEVNEGRGFRTVTACVYPVTEGMEVMTNSEKIQKAEYKPFMERIKDYLMSFAAVAIILMFFNMIQAKIQAYKQMRKSAEEYKKMLQGGDDEYPSI